MGLVIYDFGITDKSIEKNYIFKDLKLDAKATIDKRDLDESLDIDAIQNGINNIFTFAPGERVLNPEFGFDFYRYLYEPINESTARSMGEDLIEAIQRWEPRIVLNKVYIEPIEEDNTYQVEVLYTIPTLDSEKILSFNTAINARR